MEDEEGKRKKRRRKKRRRRIRHLWIRLPPLLASLRAASSAPNEGREEMEGGKAGRAEAEEASLVEKEEKAQTRKEKRRRGMKEILSLSLVACMFLSINHRKRTRNTHTP